MVDLMTEAEALCARAGTQLTDPRRRVLSLLVAAKTPLKAYDIIAKAGADGGATKPPTVYRALEFLCQLGVVHRIEQDASYIACTHAGHSHLAALFVCDACSGVTEVQLDDLQPRLTAAAQDAGFQLSHVIIEGRGRCGPCLARAA